MLLPAVACGAEVNFVTEWLRAAPDWGSGDVANAVSESTPIIRAAAISAAMPRAAARLVWVKVWVKRHLCCSVEIDGPPALEARWAGLSPVTFVRRADTPARHATEIMTAVTSDGPPTARAAAKAGLWTDLA